MPIDQEQVATALIKDTKLSKPLYESLGMNVTELKKQINGEISRGISSAMTYQDMARNIRNQSNVSLNKSIRIARTEAHRVNQQATYDAMEKAKDSGADVVKQWDSTLDRKTRPHHAQLDGQIRELDEPFEIDGLKAMCPGGFGKASEDINCRCVVLQRARWAIDNESGNTKWDNENGQLLTIDSKNYKDFKNKYFEKFEKSKTIDTKKQDADIYSLYDGSNIEKIREDILRTNGVSVPIETTKLKGAWGNNKFDIDANDNIKINKMQFNSSDNRGESYTLKTTYHELFHYKGDGKPATIFKKYLKIEETLAECYGHYRAIDIGAISDYIAPSYGNYLIEMLPKLKQIPEFKECIKIADFGKVAEFLRIDSDWNKISSEISKVSYNMFEYTSQYMPDVVKYKDELINNFMICSATNQTLLPRVTKIVDTLIEKYERNELNSFGAQDEKVVYESLITQLMAKEGVK